MGFKTITKGKQMSDSMDTLDSIKMAAAVRENGSPEPQEQAPRPRSTPDPVYAYLQAQMERLQAEFQDVVKKQAEEEKRHLLTRGRLEGLLAGIREDVTRVKGEMESMALQETDETSSE